MKAVLLIDFGSTYTKLTAVDLETESVLGTAAAYTTVQTDINDGLRKGLAALEEKTGKLEYEAKYACSSAAGGLRMVACGLVPELTSEAVRLASLGAGAKVVGLYSYQLTEDDLEEITRTAPDIFLLSGGTDGGNTANILHNARMLATLPATFPIIVAGNRTAARECQRILEGHQVHVCENVMPKFGVLNIEPTQKQIREIFLQRIVEAKGLRQAAVQMSDDMMPSRSRMLSVTLPAMKSSTSSGIWRPSFSDFLRSTSRRSCRSGFSSSVVMPHLNRDSRRASMPSISEGRQSLESISCFWFWWRWLKMWKNVF